MKPEPGRLYTVEELDTLIPLWLKEREKARIRELAEGAAAIVRLLGPERAPGPPD